MSAVSGLAEVHVMKKLHEEKMRKMDESKDKSGQGKDERCEKREKGCFTLFRFKKSRPTRASADS